MTVSQLISDRLNALPCLRGKLNEPLNASDCVQVLIVLKQIETEINKQGVDNV